MLCVCVYREWDWANGSRSGCVLKSVSLQWATGGLDLWLGLGVDLRKFLWYSPHLCQGCAYQWWLERQRIANGKRVHVSAASRL